MNRKDLTQLLRALGIDPNGQVPSAQQSSDLLKSLFDDAWTRVRPHVDSDGVTGEKRGDLRAVLEISERRLRKLRTGYLEQTLAKTITAPMPESEWFNEFNPASGAGGDRREAADIVHQRRTDGRVILDFFELKEWQSKEPPLVAAMEAYNYALLFALLYQHGVAPYDR